MDTQTLGTYFSIWNDSWKLFRRYAERFPLTEQDWRELLDDVSMFSKTHGGDTKSTIRMAVLVWDMLEAEYKKNKDGEKITA